MLFKRNNTSDPYQMRARINRGGAGYKYPYDVDNMPNFFSINMREYNSSLADITGRGGGLGVGPGAAYFTAGEYFHLPIPVSGLQDGFNIDYESQSLGALGGVASTISDLLKDPLSIVGGAASGVSTLVRNAGEAAIAALGNSVDTGVGKQAAAGASLLTGMINNPNLAALFKGVKLRRHQFSWRMIAYNASETEQIDTMVTQLKKSSLPYREFNGNFSLLYPNVAYLFLVGPKGNGMLTFSEKGCFVENITVDYNGASHPSFFAGTNSPIEVNLSMSFLERSIVTADDIGG